jgi:spore coat polysaccharide biosynthesis predicted glycosyltransferase SpsG
VSGSVAIAADGGPGQGLGHLVRSSAVATALRARGIEAQAFALGAVEALEIDGVDWTPAAEPPAANLLVLDSYVVDPVSVDAVQVVLMHDAAEASPDVALVVAPSDPSEPSDKRLSGLRFACLRPAFWGLPKRKLDGEIRRVLVTTGGGDPGGVARTLAETARDTLPDAAVRLVLGPHAEAEAPEGVEIVRANPLLGPLLEADLIISGGGQTMLEAAACGTPCVALVLAENQRTQATAMANTGAVLLTEMDGLAEAIGRLDLERRHALSERGQSLVDGYGALRVAFRIAELAG